MTTWTVIGIYADNDQRYAGVFEAQSPQDAEVRAEEEAGDELLIAGVVSGEVTMADASYSG